MLKKNLNITLNWIPKNAHVLDVGCGKGEVLKTLKQEKNIQGYGIEKDPRNVCSCIKSGLNVTQASIETISKDFQDKCFDVVILSQILQETQAPIDVLLEMLRIGKQVIVSFPNFAFFLNRFQLLLGKAPKSKNLPYDWYKSPNIRVITITEFVQLCKKESICIHQQLPTYPFANLLSPVALFLLSQE